MTYSKMMTFGTVSVGAVFTYFLYKTLNIYLKRRRYRHIPGPQSNGILGFYLGNYIEWKKAENNGMMPLDLMDQW